MLSTAESELENAVKSESETGTGRGFQILQRVRRLGVADHALDGRKRATQRALDRIDVLVNLDHAHRRRGATMEVNDLAGVGIAYPHAVDVMDRAVGGKARQGRLDGFDTVERSIGAMRQFRFQRLDVGVNLDV